MIIEVVINILSFSNNNWEKLDANASPANVANDEAKFKVTFTVPSEWHFYTPLVYHIDYIKKYVKKESLE